MSATAVGVTTSIVVDDVTADDVIVVTHTEVPYVQIGRVMVRPPFARARGREVELEAIAAWGREITSQAEAHLASLQRQEGQR